MQREFRLTTPSRYWHRAGNNDEVLCKTKRFITVDAVGSYKLTDNITVYVNVLNLFDAKAPLNAPNYAANNYNPTYTQAGAVGRFFRVGANLKF
jgi:iron complex outermembrane receptor protein